MTEPKSSPERRRPARRLLAVAMVLGVAPFLLFLAWYDLSGPGTARSLERWVADNAPVGTVRSKVMDRIARRPGGLRVLEDGARVFISYDHAPRRPWLLGALNIPGAQDGPLQERFYEQPHFVEVRFENGSVASVQRGSPLN